MASWKDHQILSSKSNYKTEHAPHPEDGRDSARLEQGPEAVKTWSLLTVLSGSLDLEQGMMWNRQ